MTPTEKLLEAVRVLYAKGDFPGTPWRVVEEGRDVYVQGPEYGQWFAYTGNDYGARTYARWIAFTDPLFGALLCFALSEEAKKESPGEHWVQVAEMILEKHAQEHHQSVQG